MLRFDGIIEVGITTVDDINPVTHNKEYTIIPVV